MYLCISLQQTYLLVALGLGRPWEDTHGGHEEAVLLGEEIGKRAVPGSKCGQKTEDTSCLLKSPHVKQHVQSQEEEREVKGKEQEHEGDGRAERANQHEEGENEPGHQIESDGVVQCPFVARVEYAPTTLKPGVRITA